MIVGLVLLVASLLLGTASPASHWRLGLATALIVATVLYWIGTTCAMAVLLRETIDPKRFSDKIVTGAATTINRHLGNPQFVAEDLYERLRVFRGWLRTVNRIGESRDLQYAIIGTRALVAEYIKTLDRPPDGNDKLHHVGRSTPRVADRDSMDPMLRDAERRGDTDGRTTPWFADELGRALVRAVESGISGNTLRRDLHRLLALFEACIEDFATVPNSAGMAEARALLTKLVEVGLGAHQVPNDARAWFVAPAVRLATLYRFFADGPTLDTPPGPADVQASQEALAGWLIVTDAVFPDPCSAACEAEFEAYLATCAPYLQDFAEHLPGARRRIRGKDLEPEWDVVVGCRARHAGQIATILRARLPQAGHLEGVDDQLCAEMVGD